MLIHGSGARSLPCPHAMQYEFSLRRGGSQLAGAWLHTRRPTCFPLATLPLPGLIFRRSASFLFAYGGHQVSVLAHAHEPAFSAAPELTIRFVRSFSGEQSSKTTHGADSSHESAVHTVLQRIFRPGIRDRLGRPKCECLYAPRRDFRAGSCELCARSQRTC